MAVKKTAKKRYVRETVVLVRTYSAGVHVGTLKKRNGREVELHNAVRIWRWRGAKTLHELSQHGLQPSADGWTRVSESVPSITLTGAIEVIPMSRKAVKSIYSAGWAP